LPKGEQVTGIIFNDTIALTMPTMVTAWAIAAMTCPSASHQPQKTNQMRFMMPEPTPALGRRTTALPKGQAT